MKDEARMCTLVCVVDREGNPRLWPIPLPREGEKDNDAWKSARIAAKLGMERWTRIVWVKRSYQARKARPSYAPDPDFSKLPPFNELVRIAFGEHGIINDVNHKVYQDHLASDESKSESDDA
jgi:hypothetical protein